ncbi:hypothetical protein [Pseudobacter ginsenosidimutans]|uniref:Lipocalin-like protein n=1 Tax=Pseudobacter ginsenosidimutans TaxID=661488 RepID=A0A4V2F259_9BACT|nr:hypothetical protein [Pseudobacter ginsenosidimutans]QEC44657.1 hypothetical protein FSB84_24345 [Pseudobacter ginsenosidimutans]RZS76137.1 hypothetical protein EV199_2016 [Pseudobacter ginsenosidimutans]
MSTRSCAFTNNDLLVSFCKKYMLLLLLPAVLSCGNTRHQHELAGRWQLKFKDGSKVLAVFRKDGTHDFFVNGKLFSSGKSSFRNDTLRASDPICKADYYATYKIDFITADSIRFKAVEDSCAPRKRDMDGTSLTRVK